MYHFRKTAETLRVQYTIPKVAAMVIQEAAEKAAARNAQHEEALEDLREKMRPSKARETKDGHLVFDKNKRYELPEGITPDMLQAQKGVVVNDPELLNDILPSTYFQNRALREKEAQEAEWEKKRQLEAAAESGDYVNVEFEGTEDVDVDNSEVELDENGEPMLTTTAPPMTAPSSAVPQWEEKVIKEGGLKHHDARGFPIAEGDGSAIPGIPTVVLPASTMPGGIGATPLPSTEAPAPPTRGGLFESTPTAFGKSPIQVPEVPTAFSFEVFCKELHDVNNKSSFGNDTGMLSPEQMTKLLKNNRQDLSKMPDAFWVTLMRQASVNVLEREASRNPERRKFYNKVLETTKKRNWVKQAQERQAKLREHKRKMKLKVSSGRRKK